MMLADSYYDFGPFRLLLSSRVLLREGRPVALTAKVFDLLVALVENRGALSGRADTYSQRSRGDRCSLNSQREVMAIVRPSYNLERH